MNYLTLISTLISAVKTIEALMPNSPGKEKREAVIAMIEGIFGSVSAALPQITELIKHIVDAFNALGVFKKSA